MLIQQIGFSAYATKPIRRQELKAIIRTHLDAIIWIFLTTVLLIFQISFCTRRQFAPGLSPMSNISCPSSFKYPAMNAKWFE